jgi:2-C-methyl-D-erythritol 2,4-cyclodiphosphate synthase
MMRIGQGFDVHRFSDDPARPLVLGGVVFPGERALAGHSDADVIAHACADALLGALGLGDIGSWFPDTDATYANADSIELLRTVVDAVHREGWRVANIDCSVVAEAPKLAPRRDEMQQRLSEVVGAPVTVKGRRAEGLGALGRREGIACWAAALVMAAAAGIEHAGEDDDEDDDKEKA